MSVLKIKNQNNNWTQIPTIKGEKGDPFTYADFTPEQLESLKGKDGISPTVSVASDTSDDYRLSFTDETHTVTTPNLIPEAEKILSVYPHDTVSGSIASFSDGADDIPLKSCIVRVEPVQDLHGYDNPWPAGGGKNKFPGASVIGSSSSRYGLTWIPQEDGGMKISGTVDSATWLYSDRYIDFEKFYGFSIGDTIAVSGKDTAGDYMTAIHFYNGSTLLVSLANGNSAVIPEGTTRVRLLFYAKGSAPGVIGETINNTVYMQIESGSTATAWTPYENICPITGWTGCEVQRTGKNIFGGEAFRDAVLAAVPTATTGEDENGRYVTITAGSASHEKVLFEYPWKENTIYTFIYRYKKNNTNGITNLALHYKDGTYNYMARSGGVEADTVHTEVLKSSKDKLLSDIRAIWGSGVATIYYDDFGVFEGDISVADFDPYQGNTYPITFPAEAGTVYGAYVDVTGGELVVDMVTRTLDGTEPGWTLNTNPNNPKRTYAYNKDASMGEILTTTEIISSYIPSAIFSGNNEVEGIYVDPAGYLFIRTAPMVEMTALVNWTTYLSNNPLQLVYELAAPIHYPLTPTEIKTLLGQNNIWADCGDTEVEYRASTKMYIDRKITEAVAAALNS